MRTKLRMKPWGALEGFGVGAEICRWNSDGISRKSGENPGKSRHRIQKRGELLQSGQDKQGLSVRFGRPPSAQRTVWSLRVDSCLGAGEAPGGLDLWACPVAVPRAWRPCF